jgi:hypothetical protein
MKPLIIALLAIVPTSAVAQSGGVPPPNFSKPGNDAQQKLLPPRRNTTNISALIEYMGRDRLDDPGEIETPVTGYANEALWDPYERLAINPQTLISGRKTGSTARGVTR